MLWGFLIVLYFRMSCYTVRTSDHFQFFTFSLSLTSSFLRLLKGIFTLALVLDLVGVSFCFFLCDIRRRILDSITDAELLLLSLLLLSLGSSRGM